MFFSIRVEMRGRETLREELLLCFIFVFEFRVSSRGGERLLFVGSATTYICTL